MKAKTKNWKQIIVLVSGFLGGFVTGIIITAHYNNCTPSWKN